MKNLLKLYQTSDDSKKLNNDIFKNPPDGWILEVFFHEEDNDEANMKFF